MLFKTTWEQVHNFLYVYKKNVTLVRRSNFNGLKNKYFY